MTKGQSKALNRRALRKAEKRSAVTRDKMLGRVARRGYGRGIGSTGRDDQIGVLFLDELPEFPG